MEQLKDLPTSFSGWDVVYSTDAAGLLETFDDKGYLAHKERVPVGHHAVRIYDEFTGDNSLRWGAIPTTSGVWYTIADIKYPVAPKVEIRPDGDGQSSGQLLSGYNFTGWSTTFSPGVLLDARSIPDFVTMRADQQLEQTVLETETKSLDSEIPRLEKEIDATYDDEGQRKLEDMKTKIKTVYYTIDPDGDSDDTNVHIRALREYFTDVPEILPALKRIFPDLDTSTSILDAIEDRLEVLERENSKNRTAVADLQNLRNQYQLLQDQYPDVGPNGVIKFNTMDDVRKGLVELYGVADDFSSELQLIGFLVDKLTERKRILEEETDARKNVDDPFREKRNKLIGEQEYFTKAIAEFVCDTSDLDSQLRREIELENRRNAAEKYKKNEGLKGRYIQYVRCTSKDLSRWRPRYGN